MKISVGTSGYSYREWQGKFYPPKLPPDEMLRFYARRFETVEINSSFRQLPDAEVVEAWTTHVRSAFRFALKAPQSITHRKRLKDIESELDAFLQIATVLNGRRGPLLFQLPPNFKVDLARLAACLERIDCDVNATAFEFRHPSWFNDDVLACLREYSAALVMADTDELPCKEITATTAFGYLRLRRKNYTAKALARWVDRIRAQSWRRAYVYFKHEETGSGPKFAQRMLDLLA